MCVVSEFYEDVRRQYIHATSRGCTAAKQLAVQWLYQLRGRGDCPKELIRWAALVAPNTPMDGAEVLASLDAAYEIRPVHRGPALVGFLIPR
jgi:hypothetical protein